jgi:MoaA/NifB/PqqE/SkfB family radical SAM enzyme
VLSSNQHPSLHPESSEKSIMPPAPDRLTKLYLEITAACNLDCEMCMRRTWHEPLGTMPLRTVERLMDQIAALPEPPIIHLGGFGEPTAHRDFLTIARMAKSVGAAVEMTTNGTLLTPELCDELIAMDFDRLYVSIDSVRPDGYEDIREGSSFQSVFENLLTLKRKRIRHSSKHGNPQLGIAFVAMQRNVADLPELPWLATRLGAWEVKVSNVVPHSPEMEHEVLYSRALTGCAYRESKQVVQMSLPKLDVDPVTGPPLQGAFNSTASLSFLDASLSARNDYCEFAQQGYAAIRWDGEVAPCMSLLHDHVEYIHGRRKDVSHYSYGNINDQHLRMIWDSPAYADFRAKLRDFPYSPCTTCGGCERFPRNYEDCSENYEPACGGCLWAQGFVQCP